MNKQHFSRLDLYRLVWSEPLRRLSTTLGVSDVAIAKRCREAGIPLPGLGYWAKKEAGKKVDQPPLPPRALGQSDEVTFGKRHVYRSGPSNEELIEMTLPAPPEFAENLESVKVRAAALAAKVRPTSLGRLHHVVAKLLEQDEVRRKEHARTGYSWYAPIFDHPNEKRRLRVLNSLLNALASLGYKCTAQAKDGYQLSTVIGDQRLSLSLAPKGFDPQKHYPGQVVPNNGKLQLRLDHWYQPPPDATTCWSDDDGPLDKRLSELVAGLLVAAEWRYREGRKRSHDWLVERKAQAIEERRRRAEEAARKERERIEREAKKRRDELMSEAAAWRTAVEIRAYVHARLASCAEQTILRDWAAWALSEADRLDPLQQS